jgi:transposase
MRVFEDGFYNLVSTYTARHKLPLIADTSYVKNVHGRDVLGRNHTDRGRNATKVSLISDSRSVPIALAFHRGNRNDCRTLAHILAVAARKSCCIEDHRSLHADKGYDSTACRNACRRFGLDAFIPRKGTSESWNDVRYAVEVSFSRFDKFRRIILRYDFSITSFKSFHFLAAACLVAREI